MTVDRCGKCGANITNIGMDFGTVWMATGKFDDVKGDYEESETTHLCPGCYREFKNAFQKFMNEESEGEE